MSERVAREGDGRHVCMCVIYFDDGRVNPCQMWVESLDAPFCETCEERHPWVQQNETGSRVGVRLST